MFNIFVTTDGETTHCCTDRPYDATSKVVASACCERQGWGGDRGGGGIFCAIYDRLLVILHGISEGVFSLLLQLGWKSWCRRCINDGVNDCFPRYVWSIITCKSSSRVSGYLSYRPLFVVQRRDTVEVCCWRTTLLYCTVVPPVLAK